MPKDQGPKARPKAGRPRERRSGDSTGQPPTYRLLIEYDGSRFSGWQEQQNARSVVGDLKKALADAGLEVVDLGGAGRTDAGVHALGQTAHLRLSRAVEPRLLQKALNERLPGSIHVRRVTRTDPRFHARHDAEARSYLYQLSRRRTAFAKAFVWWIKNELDVARMEEALALLPGRHDFRLFAVADDLGKSTLVEVDRVELKESGELILIRLVASHFLWRMVRRLIGTIVKVGLREISLEEFRGLLEGQSLASGRGTPAEWTAPAAGLFLEHIHYAGDRPLGPIEPPTPVR